MGVKEENLDQPEVHLSLQEAGYSGETIQSYTALLLWVNPWANEVSSLSIMFDAAPLEAGLEHLI